MATAVRLKLAKDAGEALEEGWLVLSCQERCSQGAYMSLGSADMPTLSRSNFTA